MQGRPSARARLCCSPGVAAEPGEQEDHRERREKREPDDGDAGGDREDPPGVAEPVAHTPAAAFAGASRSGAGLDLQRDPGEVGAASQRRSRDLSAAAWPRSARKLGFHRGALPLGFRGGELVEKALDPGLGVLKPFARPDVGAVMSWVASRRERTSPIAEKAARASPSLPLGISSSKLAPASPAAPLG